MATVNQIIQGLIGQLSPLYSGFSPPVQLAGGWPSKNHLDDITAGTYSLISIYDGDGTRNTTRWNRMVAAVDTPPAAPGVTATLNKPSILAGGTATITLTGTPNNNDGVAFSASPPGTQADVLASALAVTSETLTALAAALATSINSGTYHNGLLTATSSLGVVTLTNGDTVPYGLGVGTGNIGSRLWENRRVERHLRCIVWTLNDVNRQAVSDPLDAQLAQLENYFGFSLASGEWVRLMYHGDTYSEFSQEGDVYRRDFRISLEYGVTQTELLYPVLVGSLTFTP